MKHVLMAAVAALGLAACTVSESACTTMAALKSSFDRFAAAGEFSAETINTVNGSYSPAALACANPGATMTQVEVIALATDAIIALRQAMRESDRAAAVMYPQVRNLERMLNHAR